MILVTRSYGISEYGSAVIAVNDTESINSSSGTAKLGINRSKGLCFVHPMDINLLKTADHNRYKTPRNITVHSITQIARRDKNRAENKITVDRNLQIIAATPESFRFFLSKNDSGSMRKAALNKVHHESDSNEP